MANPNDLLGNIILYTVEEVATALKVSPRTVRNWITAKKLCAVRMGGTRYMVTNVHLASFMRESFTIPHESFPPVAAISKPSPSPPLGNNPDPQSSPTPTPTPLANKKNKRRPVA